MKIKLITCAISLAFFSTQSYSQDFLEEYFEKAGSQIATTPAGITSSQGLHVVTGGSLTLKAPRKEFEGLALEGPSLKAGCGGIDLFLGAFSIPSKEEFVSFLRSIGTSLPGLAFQLALQSMSPDLNEQVTQFRDLIQKFTDKYSDSCTASKTILDSTGATGYLTNLSYRAKNALLSEAKVDDAAEADRVTRTDGAKVLESAPTIKNSEGKVVVASELNLTWALINSGKLASHYDQETLETIMTLLGTRIFNKVGSGQNTTISSIDIAPYDILNDLYAPVDSRKSTTLKVLTCDEPTKCLQPKLESKTMMNLSNQIYEAMLHYHRSLINRNRAEVTDKERLMLSNISSLPLLSLVEASANKTYPQIGIELMKTYAQAAAYEALVSILTNLTYEAKASIGSSQSQANNMLYEYSIDLLNRTYQILQTLENERGKLFAALELANSYAATVEHIEKSVFGAAAFEAASQLKY